MLMPDLAQASRPRHMPQTTFSPLPSQPSHQDTPKSRVEISGSDSVAWRRPCKPLMCLKSHVSFSVMQMLHFNPKHVCFNMNVTKGEVSGSDIMSLLSVLGHCWEPCPSRGDRLPSEQLRGKLLSMQLHTILPSWPSLFSCPFLYTNPRGSQR